MYKGLLNTLVKPLFCSLNLLSGGAHWQPISESSGLVHTTQEKFEDAALFLRLGLRSTVIHHENGAFRKRSSNRRNLKTPALSFRVDGKHFKTDLFGQDRIRRTSDFPGRDFLKQKHKTTGDCCVFKFLRWSVDDRAKFPRLLIKSIIRRCSSMSPKRKKSEEVPRKGEMHHKQAP